MQSFFWKIHNKEWSKPRKSNSILGLVWLNGKNLLKKSWNLILFQTSKLIQILPIFQTRLLNVQLIHVKIALINASSMKAFPSKGVCLYRPNQMPWKLRSNWKEKDNSFWPQMKFHRSWTDYLIRRKTSSITLNRGI